MKTVFICHPFQNKEKNIESTKRYCKYAAALGYNPFSPALHYPQFLDESDQSQRELGMQFGIQILQFCDELWICGDRITDGMHEEIEAVTDFNTKQGELIIRHVRLPEK